MAPYAACSRCMQCRWSRKNGITKAMQHLQIYIIRPILWVHDHQSYIKQDILCFTHYKQQVDVIITGETYGPGYILLLLARYSLICFGVASPWIKLLEKTFWRKWLLKVLLRLILQCHTGANWQLVSEMPALCTIYLTRRSRWKVVHLCLRSGPFTHSWLMEWAYRQHSEIVLSSDPSSPSRDLCNRQRKSVFLLPFWCSPFQQTRQSLWLYVPLYIYFS